MNVIIVLMFLIRTADGIKSEQLAIVKDAPTCEKLADLINEATADDPNVAAVCRQVPREAN